MLVVTLHPKTLIIYNSEDKIMTNFIISALTVITMAVSFSLASRESETTVNNQLTEEQQIEIYEQVMDECVLNKLDK